MAMMGLSGCAVEEEWLTLEATARLKLQPGTLRRVTQDRLIDPGHPVEQSGRLAHPGE